MLTALCRETVLGHMRGSLRISSFCDAVCIRKVLFFRALFSGRARFLRERKKEMKQTKTLLRVVPLLLLIAFILSACGKADLWKDATYREDTTLGEGIFTVTIKVTADDKTVTFTLGFEDFSFLNEQLQPEVEPGDFKIRVGELEGIVNLA